MSELVECPACRGTGSGGPWLDPDYGPPKCERCHGLGEVDSATLVPFAWAGIPPILGWQNVCRNTPEDREKLVKQINSSLAARGIVGYEITTRELTDEERQMRLSPRITVTLTHPMLKTIDIPE